MRKLAAMLCLVCGALCAQTYHQGVPESDVFIRGDVDGDGAVCFSDSVTLLYSFFYPDRIELLCQDAADVNDDGYLNLADVISGLQNVFSSIPIAAPSGSPGIDPTDDDLCHCAYDASAFYYNQ